MGPVQALNEGLMYWGAYTLTTTCKKELHIIYSAPCLFCIKYCTAPIEGGWCRTRHIEKGEEERMQNGGGDGPIWKWCK